MALIDHKAIQRVASAIRNSKFLIFAAGAGFGVDSGLPDFRGPEGFWRAYPPFRDMGKRFEEMSNPEWFDKDPEIAWGFYGHRMNLYRATEPHNGYHLMRKWALAKQKQNKTQQLSSFVFTSNVDGAFTKCGFDPEKEVYECHGAITHLQCCNYSCSAGVWRAPGDLKVSVDMKTIRGDPKTFPHCPQCQGIARPNILMFDDFSFKEERCQAQRQRLRSFLQSIDGVDRGSEHYDVVVIECGAGTGVPTVRYFCEGLCVNKPKFLFVRINPRDYSMPDGANCQPFSTGAKVTLERIDETIGKWD